MYLTLSLSRRTVENINADFKMDWIGFGQSES